MSTDTEATREKGSAAEQIIFEAVSLLARGGGVVELRVPNSPKGTTSGYFDDYRKLALVAAKLSGRVPGVYITLNRVNPALLARSANRVQGFAKQSTSDGDVERIRAADDQRGGLPAAWHKSGQHAG